MIYTDDDRDASIINSVVHCLVAWYTGQSAAERGDSTAFLVFLLAVLAWGSFCAPYLPYPNGRAKRDFTASVANCVLCFVAGVVFQTVLQFNWAWLLGIVLSVMIALVSRPRSPWEHKDEHPG